MSVIKLTAEGQDHTMTVSACEEAKGQYGEQVKFSDGTDILYLPKASADRQLERCGFEIPLDHDYTGIVGHTLRFSRDHNPKKGASPYWGITLLTSTQKAAPSRRIASPAPERPASHAMEGHDPHAPLAGEQDEPDVAGDDPRAAKRERQKRAYFQLLSDCTLYMYESNDSISRQGHEPLPVSFEAANAMAATVFISWGRNGLDVQ